MADNYTLFLVYFRTSFRLPAADDTLRCRPGRVRPGRARRPHSAAGPVAGSRGGPRGDARGRGRGVGGGWPRPPLGGSRRPRCAEGRGGRRAALTILHRLRPQARWARAAAAVPACLPHPLPHTHPSAPPPPGVPGGRGQPSPHPYPAPCHPRASHTPHAGHLVLSHRTVVAPLKRSPTLREDLSSGEVLWHFVNVQSF